MKPAEMKPAEMEPTAKEVNDSRRDVPAAAAVASNSSPAMSYILSLIPLLNISPLPTQMEPTIQDISDSRRNVPTAPTMPTNYFPSRIPAEIRNKIYELILQDAMAVAHKHPVERSLITCRRLYGVNRQIRDEFASMVPLIVHLDKVPATLPIFFPPHCLSGHCSHGKHAARTTHVRIILPNRILGPRDLTDILRTKFNTRDLSIKFGLEVPRFCRDFREGFYVCRLLNKVFGSPSAVLMAAFGSGALKSITLTPPQHTGWDEPWTWRLGLRRSPTTWLSRKGRDLVLGCLTHLQQESKTFLVNTRVCASVLDKKGAAWGEWVECEDTERLVRKY
jgi:hypothetical protein